MSEMAEKLSAWKSQAILPGEFFRAVMSYDSWIVPLGAKDEGETFGLFSLATAQLKREANGQVQLCLFSSNDTYDLLPPEAQGSHGYLFDVVGVDVFGSDLANVNTVVIDPGSANEWRIESAQFAELREWADAIGIEAVWGRLRRGKEEPDDVSRAARYSGYYLVGAPSSDGVHQITVQNDDGRHFIPVFTHTDALALALEELERDFAPEKVQTVKTSGVEAFPALASEKADGIVFNYKGPGEPMAFDLGMTQLMVDELAREDGRP